MGVAVLRALPPLAPPLQGMDKAGDFNPNSSATTKVPTWAARANSTVTAAHELPVVGTGRRTVTASVNFSGTGFSYNHRTYLYVNGVQALASVQRSNTGPLEVTGELDLIDGDLLSVWAWSSFSSRSGIAAAGTFLTVTPL